MICIKRETEDNRREICYINFKNIIKRCIGNLYLQHIFFINTTCENIADGEIEEIILSKSALKEVRYQYLNWSSNDCIPTIL
jgi:hypothetical protein